MTTLTPEAPAPTTRRRAPRKAAWLVGLAAVVVLALGACTPEENRSTELVNQARNGGGVASMPVNVDLYFKAQAWSKRLANEERFVRNLVEAPDYAVDDTAKLVIDPEKRGWPSDARARDALLRVLVHFQMSNYLNGDIELAFFDGGGKPMSFVHKRGSGGPVYQSEVWNERNRTRAVAFSPWRNAATDTAGWTWIALDLQSFGNDASEVRFQVAIRSGGGEGRYIDPRATHADSFAYSSSGSSLLRDGRVVELAEADLAAAESNSDVGTAAHAAPSTEPDTARTMTDLGQVLPSLLTGLEVASVRLAIASVVGLSPVLAVPASSLGSGHV